MDSRIPPDLCLTINARLLEAGASAADRHAALAVLCMVLSTLSPQSFATRCSIHELAETLAMDLPAMGRALKLLARVQAINLTRHHGERRIGVVPPGRRLPGHARKYEWTPGEFTPLGV